MKSKKVFVKVGIPVGVIGIVMAGALWVVAAPLVEVKSDLSVDSNTFRVNSSTNKVGVNQGTSDLHEALNVDGVIMLEDNGADPTDRANMAMIYANYISQTGDVEVVAMDEDGNITTVSSHVDPRAWEPTFQSAFGDPNHPLPFSFHHENLYIGKGAVVDSAAMAKDLGALTGKSYTVLYDLAPEEIRDVMRRYPGVEIPISEAGEEVEITQPGTVTRYTYDLEALEVNPIEIPSDEVAPVGTGEYEKRLKPGVWFDETTGKFYRERTLEEIDPGMVPDLPQWIIDRLPSQ